MLSAMLFAICFTPCAPRRVFHVVFAPCVSRRVFRAMCFALCVLRYASPLRAYRHFASGFAIPSFTEVIASARVLRLHHASAPFYGVGPMCVISLVFRLTFLRVDVDSQVVFSTETPA